MKEAASMMLAASSLPIHYSVGMLSAAARARLTVVLVGARNPHNIGAAARAMQDFGFSSLRIVNDFAAPFDAAQLEAHQLEAASPGTKSAVAAQHVMAAAQRFDTLPAAIADCSLIIATTAIGVREITQPILSLQDTAPRITETLGAACLDSERCDELPLPPRVALLFGSEKTGLTNEQLSHATLLTTIPMFAPEGERHLSMNLGQSVAVCLYELSRAGFEQAVELPTLHEAVASAADRERLTQLLLDVLHVTGYTRRFPANATEPVIRQLTQQLGSSHRESMMWMGVLKQILWREPKSDK